MGYLQLVNKPYTTIKTQAKSLGDKTAIHESRPVWVLGDQCQLTTAWECHSICLSHRSATTLTFACRLSDLDPREDFKIVFHNLRDLNQEFPITRQACSCVLRDLTPNTSFKLYYNVYTNNVLIKINIPLSPVSTLPLRTQVELTSESVVSNDSVLKFDIKTNDPHFHDRDIEVHLQGVRQRVARITPIQCRGNVSTFTLTSHPLTGLKHKIFAFPVLSLMNRDFSPIQNILALTHVEKCHVVCESTLHAIRLRCKTVYSQDVRCVIELIQNDVVRETVTICSTFDHTFENLSSDTIYDFRIQVSDVLNQTTFTYISQATKKYFINSFLATHQKLVSFGSVFEGVRFVTNMTNAKRIDIQLRTEMDIVLGAWNDVKFESTGMFIRIKDRLEITMDMIWVSDQIDQAYLEHNTPLCMYALLTGSGETIPWQTPVTCEFVFDMSQPNGEPILKTLTTHQSNASVQLVGYNDYKTNFSFDYAFHLDCVAPDGQRVGSADVVPKQCVEFNSLHPDTPYTVNCRVTCVATEVPKVFDTFRFRTLVDTEYVVLHLACEADSPWTVVFETTHNQRLTFLVNKTDVYYKVKRNGPIQLKKSEKTLLLPTSDTNHYRLHISAGHVVSYHGFEWVTGERTIQAVKFERTFEP